MVRWKDVYKIFFYFFPFFIKGRKVCQGKIRLEKNVSKNYGNCLHSIPTPPGRGGGDKELNTTLTKVIYVDHHNQRTTFTDPRLAFAVEKKNDKRDSFRQIGRQIDRYIHIQCIGKEEKLSSVVMLLLTQYSSKKNNWVGYCNLSAINSRTRGIYIV